MHDLETKNVEATPSAVGGCFDTYKEDRPKRITRDLENLGAEDLIEQTSGASGAAWKLKRKGRDRYRELVRKVNER